MAVPVAFYLTKVFEDISGPQNRVEVESLLTLLMDLQTNFVFLFCFSENDFPQTIHIHKAS